MTKALTKEEIEKRIKDWDEWYWPKVKTSGAIGETLLTYLGWTWREYRDYVEEGKIPTS